MLYCIGFCHITTWISHRYIYVPSLLKPTPISLPIPPLLVVTEHWVELPLSHRKFPPAICFTYGNAYVSKLLSQFFPTSPFSTVHKPVFYVYVSIAALFYTLPPLDISCRPQRAWLLRLDWQLKAIIPGKRVSEPLHEAGFGQHVAMSTIDSKYS